MNISDILAYVVLTHCFPQNLHKDITEIKTAAVILKSESLSSSAYIFVTLHKHQTQVGVSQSLNTKLTVFSWIIICNSSTTICVLNFYSTFWWNFKYDFFFYLDTYPPWLYSLVGLVRAFNERVVIGGWATDHWCGTPKYSSLHIYHYDVFLSVIHWAVSLERVYGHVQSEAESNKWAGKAKWFIWTSFILLTSYHTTARNVKEYLVWSYLGMLCFGVVYRQHYWSIAEPNIAFLKMSVYLLRHNVHWITLI